MDKDKNTNQYTDKDYNTDKKWTDGKPYERSMRRKLAAERENRRFTKEVEHAAYSTALNHDENTWHILNQSVYGAYDK
jgi:hypothetical protein